MAQVAVIGAGPSGLYAAQALRNAAVGVDVIDQLATPYGLVRYGVAPDHVKMKSVIRVLREPFENGAARFIGNVVVGRDIRLEELREHYHAIVYATGSAIGRTLGVPGEDLAGSLCSARFVGWYCGHPTMASLNPPLDDPDVVVVGAGNVALDVVRVLAKSPDELRTTDVPDGVLRALEASRTENIHLLIRRGPQHVRFTPAELRQIGRLENADVVVHDDGTLGRLEDAGLERRQRQNVEILREWASRRPDRGKPRRIHLRFMRSPLSLEGDGRVRAVTVERNAVDGGRIVGTGQTERINAGAVIRAIGYVAEPVEGLPYDATTGTVPNRAGRVVDGAGVVPGVYVTGWVKRGSTGVIGTNKGDAAETAAAVIEDLPILGAPGRPGQDNLLTRLEEGGVRPIGWEDWLRLDAEECRLGAARGAERIKIVEQLATLDAARMGI
jgi:ferredoxin/flavodoxin---NADP+ reductase